MVHQCMLHQKKPRYCGIYVEKNSNCPSSTYFCLSVDNLKARLHYTYQEKNRGVTYETVGTETENSTFGTHQLIVSGATLYGG